MNHPSSKRKNTAAVVTVSCIGILLLLSLLGSLLSLGEQLFRTSRFLGFLFYVLIAVCFALGIIFPLIRTWSRPIFSMYMLRDSQGHAKRRWCRRLTDNLMRCNALTEEERAALPSFLAQGDQADDLLISFFCKKFSPVIDEQTKNAAKMAFSATAVSQTALYDMLSVNLHLIRSIVESCGYRPSSPALFGLYARVLKAVFLAGDMEEMDLEELLPLVSGNAAMKLPGLVFASAAQGTVIIPTYKSPPQIRSVALHTIRTRQLVPCMINREHQPQILIHE